MDYLQKGMDRLIKLVGDLTKEQKETESLIKELISKTGAKNTGSCICEASKGMYIGKGWKFCPYCGKAF